MTKALLKGVETGLVEILLGAVAALEIGYISFKVRKIRLRGGPITGVFDAIEHTIAQVFLAAKPP